jgi:hypothetical protein
MWELRHRHLLTETLAALQFEGLEAILFKGTALAYWLYPGASLRMRGDTDLLVPMGDKGRVHDALTRLRYERELATSGEFVSYQASYTKWSPEGTAHTLDLHWKINNSELLSRLFSYQELHAAARRLPALSPQALGASAVHSLLLACMHRATHTVNPYYDVKGVAHHDANRLIWLYDIHLLAETLQPLEWQDFVRLAGAKGLRAMCLDAFNNTRVRFKTALPDSVLRALAESGSREPAADYLNGGRWDRQWMDLRALDTLADQLHLLRELIFPPADYMRGKYAGRGWLPLLYLRRGFSALRKAAAVTPSAP